jgi:hypothetical protein
MAGSANLDFGDRTAFEAAEQNPPQAIANRVAEASFKRFCYELPVVTGQGAPIANNLTRKLETAPANMHGNISNGSVCKFRPTMNRRTFTAMDLIVEIGESSVMTGLLPFQPKNSGDHS